jgi:hypothetical protein
VWLPKARDTEMRDSDYEKLRNEIEAGLLPTPPQPHLGSTDDPEDGFEGGALVPRKPKDPQGSPGAHERVLVEV